MNENTQKHLDLTIRMNENSFEVDVYEPESGETITLQHPYSFSKHPDFDQAIGNEIYSWLSLWMDERESEN